MGLDFPVCIPSAILCAKVPCVVHIWCSPCFPWHVLLGEVPWPYLTCPIATAIARNPDGISIHWSGGHRSEDNHADDVFWNPLLRSVNEYVLEPVHLPDFLSIHLLFGRAEVQGSRCTSLSVNRLLSLWRKWWIIFWCELRSFIPRKLSGWLSSGLYWCCEVAMHVEETHRNVSNPSHPLLKPCAMKVWNPV